MEAFEIVSSLGFLDDNDVPFAHIHRSLSCYELASFTEPSKWEALEIVSTLGFLDDTDVPFTHIHLSSTFYELCTLTIH